jgi:UMF1 family MFS transporter
MENQLSKKKLWRSWSMYDWANSSYNLVITSTIFPFYYVAITGDDDASTIDHVSFFGWKVINTALLNYALAFAYLCVAILIPILSSVADYTGNKKRFMKLFCYIGATACCGLFFFDRGRIEYGILITIFAAVGWCGSLVFYNAYLPEIAEEKDRDRLSAQGYGYGYIGSVLLQLICAFFVISYAEGTFAARLSFLLVGLWWLSFAQIPFRHLPTGSPIEKNLQHSILTNGFRELKKVWDQIKQMPLLKTYLAAFFFYSIGVQTVMLASGGFVMKEIRKQVNGEWVPLGEIDLISTVLIIQLVAIVGAIMMARLSKRIGNIQVLILTVALWIGICVSAYFIHTIFHFYIIAAVIGLVMGGVQSMSRSTYSKIMPPTRDTTSFFSFYDVTEKVSMAIGLFTFGIIEHLTGSMRNSIFALAIFFFIGLVFLAIVNNMQRKTRSIPVAAIN